MQRTSVHTKYFELCKKRVMSDLHNMCICSTYYVLPSTIYFIIVMGNGAVTSRLLGSRRERKIGSLWRVTVMIRELQRDDINKVSDIWLDTNIKAHNFIPAEYWRSNFKSVKEALLLAEVYVYEYDTEIQDF